MLKFRLIAKHVTLVTYIKFYASVCLCFAPILEPVNR